MPDQILSTKDYIIRFENYQGFIGYWLKTNLFSTANRNRFLIYSVIITIMLCASILPLLNNALKKGGADWLIPVIFVAVSLLLGSVFIAAIMVYLIGPILIYAIQTATFFIGPMRKRINTVALSASGIHKVSNNTSSELAWSAVYDVIETRKTILVFTNRKCALIVPKNAFDALETANKFASQAKDYWTQAKA